MLERDLHVAGIRGLERAEGGFGLDAVGTLEVAEESDRHRRANRATSGRPLDADLDDGIVDLGESSKS